MMRSLRRRFILSGMIAFGILLFLLLCGIALYGGLRVEKSAQIWMRAALDGDLQRDEKGTFRATWKQRHGWMETPMSYYLVELDGEDEIIAISEKGVWEPDMDVAAELAGRALETGRNTGRVEGFRFQLERGSDGAGQLVLMDNSMQTHMLADLLCSAGMLSLGCLGLLFLILLPISTRLVHSYALYIEKQKQFITNAGHDIKTPVAIIMSNVDAMELIQGENRWSRNIRGQTERLSALLQRLLFLARIDEGSVSTDVEKLELNALVGAELETYGEMIAQKGVRLDCDLSMGASIHASREMMCQLVHVLLDNAVQYVNEGGDICLRLERKHRRLRLILSNSVGALPDCPPQALFDRFYRGDRARTQSSGGCGVGLSAAQAICEMYRGRISAEYPDVQRICFTVELPIKM